MPTDHRPCRPGPSTGRRPRILATLAALVAIAAGAAPGAAQSAMRDSLPTAITTRGASTITADGQPCTYDACVLRVEESWFGRRIVRGQEGTLVARLGLGGPSLANVVVGSDSAVHHARLYERAQNTGTVLTLVGTLGSLASFIAYAQRDPEDDLRSELIAVNVGALVVGIVGTTFQYKARRELSRSLWWYNRGALAGR